jgi:hypothetical protein
LLFRLDFSFFHPIFVADIISKAQKLTMEKKILDALTEKYTGVKESILRRVATKLAKTVENEDDIATAVEGAFSDVLEAYGDQRATDAQKTAVANYERKHGLKDGKAVDGGKPDDEPAPIPADDTPEWAKALIEANKSLKERLDAMDGEKRSQSRRSVIDSILEPLTEAQRRPYKHMRLEDMSEDDFSALQETIKGEVDELVNEQNARSTVFGRPAQLGKQQNNQQATDKEVDAVVKTMHI